MQSTSHKVLILAGLLTSYRNFKKSFFVSLNLAFFTWKKYDDKNSHIAWLLLLLHKIKSETPRRGPINGNYKMTMAVMMMKKMLTCDGHYYKDFILQWFLLFLDLELLYARPFHFPLDWLFLIFFTKMASFWKVSQSVTASRKTALNPRDLMPPSTRHIYQSKM